MVAVDGRIVYIGSAEGARKFAPAGARIVDLHGRTVLPGLTDAHAHLAGIGYRELEFNLEGSTGVIDLQTRLKTRADHTAAGKWITGRGWIETRWTPAAFPTKQDLDAVVSDRPVLLGRAGGHGAVANSLALSLAHIDRTTPNPTGGETLRDSQTGEPRRRTRSCWAAAVRTCW